MEKVLIHMRHVLEYIHWHSVNQVNLWLFTEIKLTFFFLINKLADTSQQWFWEQTFDLYCSVRECITLCPSTQVMQLNAGPTSIEVVPAYTHLLAFDWHQPGGCHCVCTANMRRITNADLVLGQRLWRWPLIHQHCFDVSYLLCTGGHTKPQM